MIVSIGVNILLALISVLLIRGRRVGMPTAIVIWLCGFTLATTGIAGPVNAAIADIAGLISHSHK